MDELAKVELWQRTYERVGQIFPGLDEKRHTLQTVSYLIGELIQDLVAATTENLQSNQILTVDEVRHFPRNLVTFSEEMNQLNKELKRFLYRRLYRHPKVERMRVKAERFLSLLFENYLTYPALLPEKYQERFSLYGTERVVCDYIASYDRSLRTG